MAQIENGVTLEDMIELGYSEDMIRKALDRKLKESKAAQQNKKVAEARAKAITALREYMVALGVPANEVTNIELEQSFSSFEKQIAPALKVLTKLPKKTEARATLDNCAMEDALAALRAFADSL